MRITAETVIPVLPARAWPLITDARHVEHWCALGGAEIDLRPGGAMNLIRDVRGVFPARVAAVREDRLFSFRWLPEPGPLVEISLRPETGGTRVRVVESGEPADPDRSERDWRTALERLRQLAVRVAGRP